MRLSLPLLLACALAVTACSLLPQRPPAPALHDFGPRANPGGLVKSTWSTVAVEAPEWLQDENIRYRLRYTAPTRVRFYAQDRWLAPPPSLLKQRLSIAVGPGGYRLRIQLLDFEQVFDTPKSARVILGFRATVVSLNNGEVVGERGFRLDRSTPSPDATGAVTAFAALVDEAVTLLGNWATELPPVPGNSISNHSR